jgi:adenine phosphoribosyltransferase
MEVTSIIESRVRDVPDFPKPGIVFKDITPLLSDGKAMRALIDHFTKRYQSKGITQVVGIESRGFILGAPLAYALGVGLTLVRKPGKLPYKTIREEYALEYGKDSLEIHVDALSKSDRVVIIDDVLATGGTAAAVTKLVSRLEAEICEMAFLIELGFLKGADRLRPVQHHSLIQY